jgi:Lar family restriction alleviation protein
MGYTTEQTITKSCPFCGRASDRLEVSDIIYNKHTMYYVECRGCGVRGPLLHDKDESVIRWNAYVKFTIR